MDILKIYIFFISMLSLSYADENFKSLDQIRKELGSNEYGTDLSKIFPFNAKEDLKVASCVIYKTERAMSEEYAFSSLSVAGRKIISKLNVLDAEKSNEIIKVVSSMDNYGDVVVVVFKPTVAFEFVCGSDTFILNYCPETKSVNLSSAKVKTPLSLELWTTPFLVSPELLRVIEYEITPRANQ